MVLIIQKFEKNIFDALGPNFSVMTIETVYSSLRQPAIDF